MVRYFEVIKQLIPHGDQLKSTLNSIYIEIDTPSGFLTAAHSACTVILHQSMQVEDGADDLDFETSVMEALEDFIWEQLNSCHWKDVAPHWRKYYALTTLINVILLSKKDETQGEELIKLCDRGLLMGDSEVGKTLASIATLLQGRFGQKEGLGGGERKLIESELIAVDLVTLPGRVLEVPVLEKPSLEHFYEKHFQPQLPCVIAKSIEHWPAATLWSPEYIKNLYGSRTVPVEIGSKYTADDWTQKLMTLSEFVDTFMQRPSSSAPFKQQGPIGYMAQHTLFDQIPELRADIRLPEYCSLGASEEVEINAWFGPSATLTPTHYDPNHNLLAQVFGFKIIRIFPPSESRYLEPHDPDSLLFNTSQVDMEDTLVLSKHPELSRASYADVLLRPGSILYLPPKWWHFVKSLSPSFSVSFWFK